MLFALSQPVDAQFQQRSNALGNLERRQWRGQPIGSPDAGQMTPFDERLQDLLDEERVAVGALLNHAR